MDVVSLIWKRLRPSLRLRLDYIDFQIFITALLEGQSSDKALKAGRIPPELYAELLTDVERTRLI